MRQGLRITLATVAILVLLLVVPPLISVSRFKSQITQLISQSLGRPVRLSSVQVLRRTEKWSRAVDDFGYLVGYDGCCHDAGEFPLGGNLQ